MPAAPIPAGSTISLPPATVAEIQADAKDEALVAAFASGQTAIAYAVPFPQSLYTGENPNYKDRETARKNVNYDVKQAVSQTLPDHTAPEGLVIRSKSALSGKGNSQRMTVTVYYGKPTAKQAEALEDQS